MRRTPFSTIPVMLAGAVTLSACVSVLPEQPKPEAVYRFAEPDAQFDLTGTLVIHEPEAPRLLAGRQIAVAASDDGLKIIPGVAWADRSTRLFQVTMIDTFSESGGGYAVDDVAGFSGDYELFWRVSEFSLKGGSGHCTLRLTLMDGGSRDPVAQETVMASVPASGTGARARAKALSEAGRDCVADGARHLANTIREKEARESGAED
ncbi:ABC-type transport auxiliary lipoprotein family protein [Henriciella sp.]|uniref:ABC-type transport auxiliary lipoprotein family protein n=1 Tax=Henriciella sp. TaxID=1968823 RepID=UPI0026296D8D|nr:ABC-type transport auxiliary lipoprotein family protein [Henriciella sp.]